MRKIAAAFVVATLLSATASAPAFANGYDGRYYYAPTPADVLFWPIAAALSIPAAIINSVAYATFPPPVAYGGYPAPPVTTGPAVYAGSAPYYAPEPYYAPRVYVAPTGYYYGPRGYYYGYRGYYHGPRGYYYGSRGYYSGRGYYAPRGYYRSYRGW